jgi:hypothetical protein
MKTTVSAGKSGENVADPALCQRIGQRAYYIWLASGCLHGDHEHHWFQAEREVMEAARLEQQSGTREKKRTGKPH